MRTRRRCRGRAEREGKSMSEVFGGASQEVRCNGHDLTLHATLSDRAATIRLEQELWAQRKGEQMTQTRANA
jgi:hypothetical protein